MPRAAMQVGINVFIAVYTQFLHFLVVSHFIIGEAAILAEYDIEAHSDYAYGDYEQGNEKNFH